MPQHDLILDNGSGAAFRADANGALEALGTTMKGPNAPPSPRAGMMWLDDDTPSATVWTLKQYDGAEWISVGEFNVTTNSFVLLGAARAPAGSAAAPAYSFAGDTDTGFLNPSPNTIQVSVGGSGVFSFAPGLGVLDGASIFSSSVFAIRHASASSSSARANEIQAWNELSTAVSSFSMTINTDGSSDINIASTPPGARASDRRVNRVTIPGSGAINIVGPVNVTSGALQVGGNPVQIQRGTELATTSGTAIDFTGIPAGVRRITVMFDAVSFTGADAASIQLGDSGGIETTGYVGQIGIVAGVSAGSNLAPTGAAQVIYNGTAAADNCSGVVHIVNQSGNKWLISGNVTRNGTVPQIYVMQAAKTLSDVLDRIRFKVDGASSFDAGSVNIMWEF